ncbi:hypothetical protein Tco_0366057 [Tanacetum coccineum]
MVERDDEIKVLGEIKLELQSGTHKVIEKLIQKKVSQQEALKNEIKVLGEVNVELESGSKKLRENLRQEEDIKEEAFEEFSSTLDNVLEKLSQENESPDDFYGLMYDTDDDASISGKSCEHFGWDWDSPGTEVDWQDDPLHETEDLFVGLDQPIQLVVSQNNIYKGVIEEVIEMANGQVEALSSDKEVTDECLDDEQVGESRPSKKIRVTKEEMSRIKSCETSKLLLEVVTFVCETSSLIWVRHMQIYFDIQGLSYRRNNMNGKLNVIHCDIKSANIIVDDIWSDESPLENSNAISGDRLHCGAD